MLYKLIYIIFFLDIYEKDLISIIHLLVALIKFYNVPVQLPENITVKVIIIQKKKKLEKITVTEQITQSSNENKSKIDRDAFDTLFDHAPEKLNLVKNSLLTFMRKHLDKIKFSVNDLDSQLNDGVYLLLLIGLLENYFLPEYAYHPAPTSYEHKLENCKFLFQLMDDAGLSRPNCRPEGIYILNIIII